MHPSAPEPFCPPFWGTRGWLTSGCFHLWRHFIKVACQVLHDPKQGQMVIYENTNFSPCGGRTSWCSSSLSLLSQPRCQGAPPPSSHLLCWICSTSGATTVVKKKWNHLFLCRFSDPPPQPVNTYTAAAGWSGATMSDLLLAEAWEIGFKCFPGHPSDHTVTSPNCPLRA